MWRVTLHPVKNTGRHNYLLTIFTDLYCPHRGGTLWTSSVTEVESHSVLPRPLLHRWQLQVRHFYFDGFLDSHFQLSEVE